MRGLIDSRLLLFIYLALWACTGQESAKETPPQPWYKGNLHTHSFWSDGDEFPEMIMEWYKNHDYQFIALSDHNILANKEHWVELDDSLEIQVFERYLQKYGTDWVDFKEDSGKIQVRLKTLVNYRPLFEEEGKFIILQAEEITDKFEGKPLHLNATNISDLIEPQGGGSVTEVLQNNINAVLNQKELSGDPMIVHINHPNFHYAITVEDMIALQGEQFFEVFNGHPQVFNLGDSVHMDTETMWDQINIAYIKNGKPPLYGLATDDSHNYHRYGSQWSNSGRGWIMVEADTLSPASIINSLERGAFYASTGVTFKSLTSKNNSIHIELPEDLNTYTIQFIGCHQQDSESRVLKEVRGNQAAFELTREHLFVRAKVVSSEPPKSPVENIINQMAWTQPVIYHDEY